MDPFIGQITLLAFSFAPQGWAKCDGQLLPIPQNQAVFALLGTRWGGDGRNNFALPDLRGRAPIHRGSAPSLAPQELASATRLRTVAQTDEAPGLGAVAMNYCIALQGYWPVRD